ncbi:MAG TPA: winged helix-turn-helix domain-containing protein [Steroidobacteraceae bacterium]|nr:winged helix-turn-helix domain-containing protein [Steroidobacteraceae bacterium]
MTPLQSSVLCVGDFRVDPALDEISRDGATVKLEPRTMRVLLCLAEHAGQVVSVHQLLDAVWKDVVVTSDSVYQAVAGLRRALGDTSKEPAYIANVMRRGYRLVARVAPWVDAASLSIAKERAADVPSLAVLPFVNLAKDADQDYFAEGMMDEVVTALTRIRSLFVIASSATKSLKDQALDPHEVARRLGVRYILEGSVRRANSRVRISVKLTDARGGAQIWAEHFDDTLEDIFALQDRVALSVAGVIEPNIQAAELRRVARNTVENPGCYDLYLRAAHLRATLRKAEVIQALELLDRALALEPEFAPALAQAAGCHSQLYFNRWTDNRDFHRAKGLIMAERAVRAGADDAAVLAQVANALMELDPAIDRASALIERATTLNPGSAYAWFISGVLKLIAGHSSEAVEHLERAARLDPISRLNEIARAHIAVGRALLGDFEQSLRIFRAITYRTPRVQLFLPYVCAQLGLWPEAREELRIYEQLTNIQPEAMLAQMTISADYRARLLDAFAQVRSSAAR